MPVLSRPSSPNTPREHGFRGWIKCDGTIADGHHDGDPCMSGSRPAFGADIAEAENQAREAARSDGWSTLPGPREVWRCPTCTAEATTSPPPAAQPAADLDHTHTAAPRRPRRQASPPAQPRPPGQDPLPGMPVSRYAPDQVYDICVGDLMPDPTQPRKLFDPDALRTLGESMRAAGQQHPCRFRERLHPEPGTAPLILVDGERRWRAAQLAGLPTVRAVLDTSVDSGADLVIRQALLNEPGRPLQPWDWVLTFHHLATQHQLTPAQIAVHLADKRITNNGRPWSRPMVANHLRTLQLPAWAQDLISDGPLTVSHGIYLLPHLARPAVMDGIRAFLEKRTAEGAGAATDPEQDAAQDPEQDPGGSPRGTEGDTGRGPDRGATERPGRQN